MRSISRALGCLAAVALVMGCRAGSRLFSIPPHRPLEELIALDPIDRADADVVAYAELCKEELGITGPLPDMSCVAGVEVPITINGQAVTEPDLRALATGRAGCDRSQWLDGECWTYDLVQRVAIQDDVEAVLNCRQKLFTNTLSVEERKTAYEEALARNAPLEERLRLWRLIFEFDDLGLILRNRHSGKTCFFTFFGKLDLEDQERSFSFYGGLVPAPDRVSMPSRDEIYRRLPEPKPPEEYPERMWNRGPRGAASGLQNMFFTPMATADGDCVGCHNHGAFKHSPFIDQAHAGELRIVPSNERDVPYLLVGRAFQESFRKFDVREIDTEPVAGTSQACTLCHRLTSGSVEAAERRDWATGDDVPKPSFTTRRLPHRAWMPFEHGLDSEDAYHRSVGPLVEAIRCCSETPEAPGCRWRAIGPTLDDVVLDEEGRLSDDGWVSGADPSLPSCVAPGSPRRKPVGAKDR